MKKALFLAACILVAGVTKAQTTTSTSSTSDDVQFGIKAGANFSNIIKVGNDDFKTSFKPGFNVGLFAEIPVTNGLAFAPEVVYSQTGYKRTGNSLVLKEPVAYSVTSNFIEVPLLAKIKVVDDFNVVLGPQVSFLLSTPKAVFKQGSPEYQATFKEENKNLNKVYAGGVIGAGYDITPEFNINGRYALDFQKNTKKAGSEIPRYANQSFQLGLGYKF